MLKDRHRAQNGKELSNYLIVCKALTMITAKIKVLYRLYRPLQCTNVQFLLIINKIKRESR